ncbi:MAG: alpha/beta fold hydrolase [Singulisphaera sp.]
MLIDPSADCLLFDRNRIHRAAVYRWRIVCQLRWIGISALVVMTLALPRPLFAEEEQPKAKLPPRKDVTLSAEDDMALKATFWPGPNGKDSVPVIALHGYGGSRHDYSALAEFLQEKGCAVLAPDLRGHGESTLVPESNRRLSAADMPIAAFAGMIDDVEAAKKFLMQRNNAGELNIDKLCLIGADMGAVVGANWAIDDWNWPPLAVGKQGQDVKAIILLSPPEKFKSLRMLEALNDRSVRSQVAFYIAVGNQDPTAVREATKIHNTLKKFHPLPVKPEDQDLFFDRRIPTRLQGTKLLGKEFKEYGLMNNIAEFIDERAAKQPYVWQDRKLP